MRVIRRNSERHFGSKGTEVTRRHVSGGTPIAAVFGGVGDAR